MYHRLRTVSNYKIPRFLTHCYSRLTSSWVPMLLLIQRGRGMVSAPLFHRKKKSAFSLVHQNENLDLSMLHFPQTAFVPLLPSVFDVCSLVPLN